MFVRKFFAENWPVSECDIDVWIVSDYDRNNEKINVQGDYFRMSKHMKKFSLVIAVALLALMVAACGNGKSGSGDKKTYTIAISQILEHPSLDATRQGFLDALKDAGIVEGDNLKVDYHNAQNDSSNNLSIAKEIASKKYDLVLGIATPSASAVANEVKDMPVLFAAVSDPKDVMENPEAPEGNVTGASDTNLMATEQIMDFIAEFFPDTKNVGLIINEGEPNAVFMAENAEKALQKHGISLIRAAVVNSSEVKQAAQSLVGRADVFFITLDNTVVDAVDAIVQVANDNDIPFFSSDRDSVERGAFATVGFKYYDHGYEAGQMAVEILKNGKKPADLPVIYPEKVDFILNLSAAKEQGVTVTDAMKAKVQDPENNIIE
jgi:putative ABC transport system substrate-binding protein